MRSIEMLSSIFQSNQSRAWEIVSSFPSPTHTLQGLGGVIDGSIRAQLDRAF